MQQPEEYELPRGEYSVAQGPAEQPVLFSTINFEGLREFEFISSTFARRSTYFSGDITTPAFQVNKERRHATVAPICASVNSWRCF